MRTLSPSPTAVSFNHWFAADWAYRQRENFHVSNRRIASPAKHERESYRQFAPERRFVRLPLVLAIPGAIFSLLSLAPVLFWHAAQLSAAVPGTILGFLSLRDIKRGQGRLRERALAVTGFVISLVATVAIMPAVLVGMVLPTIFEAKKQTQSMLRLKAIVTGHAQIPRRIRAISPRCDL